jgi:C-terminal processing protease CtpA/Prc
VVIGVAIIIAGILMYMASRYNGMWKTEGYGLCLKINYGIVRVYSVTENHYTDVKAYNGFIINKTLYCGMGKFRLSLQGDRLTLYDEGSRYSYVANRQKKGCLDGLNKVGSEEQEEKFKLYYETLKENYAFADLYEVDFDEEYNKYASNITKDTSDEELYDYMCKMVNKLDDGHVELSWGDMEFSPSDYLPEWMKDMEQVNSLVSIIKKNYLHNYYRFDDCYIRYGEIREDIGYIVIQALGMEKIDKSASTKKAMDKIIKKFQNKDTIVIDLRFCEGGFDETSLLIAGYFAPERYLAYKKHAYDKGEYTELQSIYVEPMGITYNGEVIIITNGYTISAGETFARAMLANKNNSITVIGEATAGYYSDTIPLYIPGDYSFAMSTERYYWYDDTLLEGKGVVPDIEIPYSYKAVQMGKDPALEWILDNH